MLLTLEGRVSRDTSHVPVAHMAQEDKESAEELGEADLIPADAVTLEVAAMTGSAAALSEETIEAIAQRVAEKVMSMLAEIESEARQ